MDGLLSSGQEPSAPRWEGVVVPRSQGMKRRLFHVSPILVKIEHEPLLSRVERGRVCVL